MEMPIRGVLLSCAISAIVGGYIESTFTKSDKISVIKKDESVETNKRHVVAHEVIAPDGSKTIDSDTTEDIVEKKKSSTEVVEEKAASPKNWFVQAGTGLDLQLKTEYVGGVNYRLLGPIWVGVWASTSQRAGANLGLQF